VTISGGTITANGEANAYIPVSSGFQDTGDALYVEHYDNSANSENYGTPTVTVTGGTFVSNNGNSIASYANPNNAANGVAALTQFVSGGCFNPAPADNLAKDGYVFSANGDGTYGVVEKVALPEVVITDIKNTLKDSDPDLTFALNFAIKDIENLDPDYLEDLFNTYGSYYTDYVLTISGLTDANVTFNADGSADGYLAGAYQAWNNGAWVSVPFEDVTVANGESLYIMAYAAELMGQSGLRFTLAEVAEIVQNFDCGVYFTPEFLAANPDMQVNLQLKVFTEDAEGNKIDNIDVAENNFKAADIKAIIAADGKQTQYFATLAAAVAAAEAGDTVTMLASVGETVTVDKPLTISRNGYSTTKVNAAVGYVVNEDTANDAYVVTVKAGVVAVVGEETFETVSAALTEAAKTGATVKLVDDATETMVIVPNGTTLDLNGNVLTVNSMLIVLGSAIDTTEANGGLVIAGAAAGNVVFQNKANYLPVYDSTISGYRLFEYVLRTGKMPNETASNVSFVIGLEFTCSKAYEMIMDDDNVKVAIDLSWEDYRKQVVFAEPLIRESVEGFGDIVLYVNVTGLDNLSAGTVLSAAATVVTDLITVSAEPKTYVKPEA